MIYKKYLDPISKGRMQKHPTKNNHFLNETGEKKKMSPKFMKYFFGKLTLSRRRVGKPSLIFADFLQCFKILRSHEISANYRTAHPLHCKEKKIEKISKHFKI